MCLSMDGQMHPWKIIEELKSMSASCVSRRSLRSPSHPVRTGDPSVELTFNINVSRSFCFAPPERPPSIREIPSAECHEAEISSTPPELGPLPASPGSNVIKAPFALGYRGRP